MYKFLIPWRNNKVKEIEINSFHETLDLLTKEGKKMYAGRPQRLMNEFLNPAKNHLNLYSNLFIEDIAFIKNGKQVTHIKFTLSSNQNQKVKSYTSDPKKLELLMEKEQERRAKSKFILKSDKYNFDYDVPELDYNIMQEKYPTEFKKIKTAAEKYKDLVGFTSQEVDHIYSCCLKLENISLFYQTIHKVVTKEIVATVSLRALVMTIFMSNNVKPFNKSWEKVFNSSLADLAKKK